MDFYSKLELQFTLISTDFLQLNEKEWYEMIKLFCVKLADKPIGNIIISKLDEFISNDYNIIISNYDSESVYIHPKVKYIDKKLIIIIIPSLPYFVNVEIIDINIFNNINSYVSNEYYNFLRVNNYETSTIPLDTIERTLNNNTYKWLQMPQFIAFAHELIHVLRYFEGFNIRHVNEEANVIYGLESNVLTYTIMDIEYKITENMVRKDFNLRPRVSHDSKEIYCYSNYETYVNHDKFSKEDFYN